MGVQLNIKSEEAYALASEIAARTGESLTQVVLEALRARAKAESREQRFRNAMTLCEDIASRMSPETLAFDIDKELYDEETGLPK
jgi:antitoxin VapB